jgi:hypothetical protein
MRTPALKYAERLWVAPHCGLLQWLARLIGLRATGGPANACRR